MPAGVWLSTDLLVPVEHWVDACWPGQHLTVKVNILGGKQEHVNEVREAVLGLGDALVELHHALGASLLHKGDHVNEVLARVRLLEGPLLNVGKLLTDPATMYHEN